MYPAGVNLATVQTGVYSTLESGQNLAVSITATASVTDIVWSTDGISGNPYMSQPFSNVCNVGENVGLNLLPTNLDKWWYNGEPVISGGANHAFSYTITAQALYQDAQGRQQPLGAPLTWQNVLIDSNNGVPGTIDLDMLAKDASGTTLVTIALPAWVQQMSDAMNAVANNAIAATSASANSAANSATAAATANTNAQAANTAAQTAKTAAQAANSAAWNAANGVGANLDPVLANVMLSAGSNSYAAVFGAANTTYSYYANGLINNIHEVNVGVGQNRDSRMNYYANGLVQNITETVTGHNTAVSTYTWDANNNLTSIVRTVL